MTAATTAVDAPMKRKPHTRVQATLGAQIRWDDAELVRLFRHCPEILDTEDARQRLKLVLEAQAGILPVARQRTFDSLYVCVVNDPQQFDKLIARAKAKMPSTPAPSVSAQLRWTPRENTLIANDGEVMQALDEHVKGGALAALIEAVVNAQIRQFPMARRKPRKSIANSFYTHGFAAQLRALQATEARPVGLVAAPKTLLSIVRAKTAKIAPPAPESDCVAAASEAKPTTALEVLKDLVANIPVNKPEPASEPAPVPVAAAEPTPPVVVNAPTLPISVPESADATLGAYFRATLEMSLAAVVDARLDAAMDRAVARYFERGQPLTRADLENALGMRLDARVNALLEEALGGPVAPPPSPAITEVAEIADTAEIVIEPAPAPIAALPPEVVHVSVEVAAPAVETFALEGESWALPVTEKPRNVAPHAPHDITEQLEATAKALGMEHVKRKSVLVCGLHPRVFEELERSQGRKYRFTYVKQDHFNSNADIPASTDAVILSRKRLTHEQQQYVRRFSIPVRMVANSLPAAEWALNEMAKESPNP